MARKTQTVTLPEPTQLGPGKWEFPEGWSETAIRDWLDSHPERLNGHASAEVEDQLGGGGSDWGSEYHEPLTDDDAPNYDADMPEEEHEHEDVKEERDIAVGVLLPEDYDRSFDPRTYNPREYFLVHHQVVSELLQDQATIALYERELRALQRGMRKVNRHWSDTKRELRRERLIHTRTARKLRKARAGRDRRDRQLAALTELVNRQAEEIKTQNDFINHAFGGQG